MCDVFSEKNKQQNAILINKHGGLELLNLDRAVESSEEVMKPLTKFSENSIVLQLQISSNLMQINQLRTNLISTLSNA